MTSPPSSPPPGSHDALPPEQVQQVLALLHAIAQHPSATAERPKDLTVQDAAAYCRVAVQTIYNNRRYIERMPGVRKLLFTREALDAWLATRRTRRRGRR